MPKKLVESAVLLALVTAAGCESPGAPDRSTTYAFEAQGTGEIFHWPRQRLPVRYFAENRGGLRRYVSDAVALWKRQFIYGEFDGVLVGDSLQADVIIRFTGDTPPTAEPTDAPPVVACRGRTRIPDRADGVTFDGPIRVSLEWFDGNSTTDIANCLARVTAHEVGHTLGLLQHSSSESDLMFGNPMVTRPSEVDRTTVQVLYHTPADLQPPELSE